MVYLHIAPDGTVKAALKREELKTPYKYAGYEGVGVELLSAAPFALDEFKPKEERTAAAAPKSADVAALVAQNLALQKLVQDLLAKVAVPAPPATGPAAAPAQ